MAQYRSPKSRSSTTRGFKRTSGLLEGRVREASESRGFAVSRVLTHWVEIVGEAIASTARPVKVTYAKGGFGATLTLLTTSARAPMLEMQKEEIRTKVNACYGYNAISRVRITQTAPTGFAEGQVAFTPAPKAAIQRDADICARAAEAAAPVQDESLRNALAALGENILNKRKGT